MELQLKNNYVLFASTIVNQKEPVGIYLKKRNGYIVTQELEKHEIRVFEKFPCLYSSLQSGSTLQIYQKHFWVWASLGKLLKEGPYGETSCFDITNMSVTENCFLSLIELEKDIEVNGTEKCIKRAYEKGYVYYE